MDPDGFAAAHDESLVLARGLGVVLSARFASVCTLADSARRIAPGDAEVAPVGIEPVDGLVAGIADRGSKDSGIDSGVSRWLDGGLYAIAVAIDQGHVDDAVPLGVVGVDFGFCGAATNDRIEGKCCVDVFAVGGQVPAGLRIKGEMTRRLAFFVWRTEFPSGDDRVATESDVYSGVAVSEVLNVDDAVSKRTGVGDV